MKTEISQDYEVKVGDKLEMNFQILSIFTDAQVNYLINKVNEDGKVRVDNYRVENHSFFSDILIIEATVVQNPFPLALILIAITSIAGGLFIYLSLQKVYLIATEAPLAAASVGIGFLAAVVIGGYFLLFHR